MAFEYPILPAAVVRFQGWLSDAMLDVAAGFGVVNSERGERDLVVQDSG
jgi:hypothetical protein